MEAERQPVRTPRGAARRLDLLRRVTDDLAERGLADFSLRRAARAAGTTHKVLLYHFGSGEKLLAEAVTELRRRRTARGEATAPAASLAERVRALWPVLVGAEGAALHQAMGLAMYDPQRHAALARDASAGYLVALVGVCPPEWPERRKREVAAMILATLRGFLLDRYTSGSDELVDLGFAALERALRAEEAKTVDGE